MPGGKVTTNDVEQGFNIAGSVLYGDILKDYVSDEKKAEIYKKVSLVRVLYNSIQFPELLNDYPQVQNLVVSGNEHELVVNDVSPEANRPGQGKQFLNHPETEKLIKLHREGLREISGLLEERLSKGNFKSLSEQNYCYMMKSFIDDLAAGNSFKSLSEDKQFEFAHNMTAKFRVTSATFTVEEGKFKPIPTYTQDAEVIKRIESTGIVNSMVGAKRINDLTKKHLENGDIARGELLEEYKQQMKRLNKHFSLTEESFNDLVSKSSDLRLFDNEYNEILGQYGRGFSWAKVDLDAKIEAMEAGWPISDLSALAEFVGLYHDLEGAIPANERLIKANQEKIEKEQKKENPNQEQIENWTRQIEKYQNDNEEFKKTRDEMKLVWDDAVSSGLDLTKRKERLQSISDLLGKLPAEVVKEKGPFIKDAKEKIDKRLNAKLEEHEKTLLVNTATEMLEKLEAVDPSLVKSSEEFKNFKKELKELASMERDGICTTTNEYYREQAAKVMEAGAVYLRYKTRQLNKDSSHKRSDLEERRVRTVDSILGRLNVADIPGALLGTSIHSDDFNPVYNKGYEPDVIYEEVIDKSVKSYDNYIKLHTGRVAANGTKEEMIEDLSKVIAAQALKLAYGEPFSKKEIDKQAKNIRVLYNLDNVKTEDLAKALCSPTKAESFIVNRQKELSETKGLFVKNNAGEYKNYKAWWDNMSGLYRMMNSPDSYDKKFKSDAYKKLFETVKEAAHMPRPGVLGKMDRKQIENKVAQLNFRMMQYANIAVDEKGFQDKTMNHDALHVLCTLKAFTFGAENIVNNVEDRIDQKRYDKDPESLKFVARGYGAGILYKKRKELNNGKELRQPDEEEILKSEGRFHKGRSAKIYTGSGLNIDTAFNGKYKDAILIDGQLPKEKAKREAAALNKAKGPKKANKPEKADNKNVPKVTQEEPAPKVNRPHL